MNPTKILQQIEVYLKGGKGPIKSSHCLVQHYVSCANENQKYLKFFKKTISSLEGIKEHTTYAAKKNQATLKHLTPALVGRKLVKLSQCKKNAKPLAEQPPRRAWT